MIKGIRFTLQSVALMITSTVFVLLGGQPVAQAQHPLTPVQYSQFRSMLNPATSLLRPAGELGTLGRRQWVGVEGSPTVLWGSGHVGLGRLGATAGLNIRHESFAVEQLTETSAFFAKSVRLSERDYIGMALSTGLVYHQGRFSQLDPQDPAFRDDVRSTDGLMGFGFVFYRPERYYAGISLPRLLLGNGDDQNRYELHTNYHLTAGGLVDLGTDFHLRPSVLVSYAKNLGTEADFSAMFLAKRLLGLGLNVRTNGDVAGMLEVRYGGLGLGYGYQFNSGGTTLNRRIDNSTHEIGLNYRFGGQQGLL